MASIGELNAFFDCVEKDLHRFVQRLPGFVQGSALEHLDSQEGRQEVLDTIRRGFAASEKVRAAEAAAAPKPETS